MKKYKEILKRTRALLLAGTISVSSLLAGCGKEEEPQVKYIYIQAEKDDNNVSNEVVSEYVDNHNGELYIAKESDIEAIKAYNEKLAKEAEQTSTNNKTKTTNKSNKKDNSTTNDTTTNDTTIIDNKNNEEKIIKGPGEEVIISYPSEENNYYYEYREESYYSGPGEETYIETTNPTVDNPQSTNPSTNDTVEPTVNDVKKYGYVLVKQNEQDFDNVYMYSVNDGNNVSVSIVDKSTVDMSMLNMDTNIYCLSDTSEREGWKLVRTAEEKDANMTTAEWYDGEINREKNNALEDQKKKMEESEEYEKSLGLDTAKVTYKLYMLPNDIYFYNIIIPYIQIYCNIFLYIFIYFYIFLYIILCVLKCDFLVAHPTPIAGGLAAVVRVIPTSKFLLKGALSF